MYLSGSTTIAIALAMMAAPAFAGSENAVCHNDNTTGNSQYALGTHQDHDDTAGACPPAPVYKDVAVIRCRASDDGDLVISGPSVSEKKAVDPQRASGEISCASTVAHMIIMGTALNR